MKDKGLEIEGFLPAAGGSNQTPTLEVGALGGVKMPEIEVTVPAAANHTDPSKVITLTLQDSPDDVTYTDVAAQIQGRIPGVAETGSPATTLRMPLPRHLRPYVQFTQAVPEGDGDSSDVLVTYSLVFDD